MSIFYVMFFLQFAQNSAFYTYNNVQITQSIFLIRLKSMNYTFISI